MAKYPFKRKPLKHQMLVMNKLKDKKAAGIWLDPGLGKTKVAIDLVQLAIMRDPSIQRIIIFCPLSAYSVWEDDWRLDWHLNEPDVKLLVGSPQEKLNILNSTSKDKVTIIIASYDISRNDLISEAILRWKSNILVMDEMDYAKNRKSKRNKFLYKLAYQKSVKYKWGLTGTPLRRDLDDIYGQVRILDKDMFGTFKEFSDKYTVRHYVFTNKIVGYKNLDEFKQKLRGISVRISDKNVGLPQLFVRNIRIPIHDTTRKIYDNLAKEMIARLSKKDKITADIAAVKVLKLQSITSGYAKTDDGRIISLAEEKTKAAVELTEKYINTGRKVIIGCRFIHEYSQVQSYLLNKGIKSGIIAGGIQEQKRKELIKRFRESDLDVIIFQIASATAVTLIEADVAILVSSTYGWGDYYQWSKRIHRIGQDKPCYIIRLFLEDTLDKKILDTIDGRGDFLEEVTKNVNLLGGR